MGGRHSKDYIQTYQRNWVRERRNAWIESQGGVCVKCGSKEDLEVDHKNPELKAMHASALWSRDQNSKIVLDELSKCQVLCNACHKAKTSQDRRESIPTHGLSAYRVGLCRCDKICRPANAAYRRERRAKLKQARLMEQQT
jgi:hypothetical protein